MRERKLKQSESQKKANEKYNQILNKITTQQKNAEYIKRKRIAEVKMMAEMNRMILEEHLQNLEVSKYIEVLC